MPMATKTPPAHPLAVKVGRRIRALRLARGMKQETLAAEVGYSSRGTIAQFESGLALPSAAKARDLARALGVQMGDLLNDAEGEESEGPSMETTLRLMLSQHARQLPLPMLKCLVDIAAALHGLGEQDLAGQQKVIIPQTT